MFFNFCYVADMFWSYCVAEGLAPFLDKTLIPGFWVSGGNPTNDRLIQLSQGERERIMYTHFQPPENMSNITSWIHVSHYYNFIVLMY